MRLSVANIFKENACKLSCETEIPAFCAPVKDYVTDGDAERNPPASQSFPNSFTKRLSRYFSPPVEGFYSF